MAVRTAVGLFDVSHMGEIQFRGPGALAAVQHITMNDASRLKDGQAHYSALLTPEGTFVDDILVHRLGENDYLLVVNAGTKDKDYAWIRQQVGGWPGIHINDYSSYYSQLALQGPRALETLQKLTKVDLGAIKNYWFTWGQVAGVNNVLIARTGYSGEDGFEVYIPSDEATTVKVWNALLEAGAEFGIRPCGLGARNTLRLEAGMSLYGHEISDEINVFEAGLKHWLKLDKGEFIGRVGAAGGAGSGRPEAEDRWAGDGGARDWAGRVLRSFTFRRRDWPDSLRARRRRFLKPTLRWRWCPQRLRSAERTWWLSAVGTVCERNKFRCLFINDLRNKGSSRRSGWLHGGYELRKCHRRVFLEKLGHARRHAGVHRSSAECVQADALTGLVEGALGKRCEHADSNLRRIAAQGLKQHGVDGVTVAGGKVGHFLHDAGIPVDGPQALGTLDALPCFIRSGAEPLFP